MFLSWLLAQAHWNAPGSRRRGREIPARKPSFRPSVEQLDARILLSGGTFNPNFGVGGLVTSNFGGQDFASGVATQANGKIVVAGEAYQPSGSAQLVVSRYNMNGTLDASFGAGGKVLTLLGSKEGFASEVAIRGNGKIVVATEAVDPVTSAYDLAVVQYNSNGSLDSSFGSDGSVLTGLGGGHNFFLGGIALAPGGRVIVVGSAYVGFTQPVGLTVIECNSNGSLNASFGSGGIVTTTSFQSASGQSFTQPTGNAVAVDSLGRIVVAGQALNAASRFQLESALLVRYNTNGSLDQRFGFQGAVTSVFDGPPTNALGPIGVDATALALLKNGDIAVGGYAFAPSFGFIPYEGFAVERFTPRGSADLTFGSEGVAFYGPPFGDAGQFQVAGLAAQANGDIVAVGTTLILGVPGINFAMVRFTPSGILDSSFGSGGVVTAFVPNAEGPFIIALEPTTGNIVVVGTAYDATANTYDFALAEYLSH
jgi:uncharacterized delta-60 repeat protein